jgi:hypothetical protein
LRYQIYQISPNSGSKLTSNNISKNKKWLRKRVKKLLVKIDKKVYDEGSSLEKKMNVCVIVRMTVSELL